MERYEKIRALYLEAYRQALAAPIEVDHPIVVYFQRVEDATQFAQDGKTLFTPSEIVQTAYHAVNKTGIYSIELKEWCKKVMSKNKWDRFNASLTAHLSESMNINLEMAKKLNLKSAQGQDIKGKIRLDKSNRKSDFERNLDPTGY